MKKEKIAVYVTAEQKSQINKFAQEANLSVSEFLLCRGLEKPIESSRVKSGMASIACQLYSWADTLKDTSSRERAGCFGGQIYGVLENQA